jgi:hypothetical protein
MTYVAAVLLAATAAGVASRQRQVCQRQCQLQRLLLPAVPQLSCRSLQPLSTQCHHQQQQQLQGSMLTDLLR